jgi:hypothetical protein
VEHLRDGGMRKFIVKRDRISDDEFDGIDKEDLLLIIGTETRLKGILKMTFKQLF